MAVELPLFKLPGKVASADLSSYQYCFVSLDSSGDVQLATDGDVVIGVLQNEPDAAGEPCEIITAGITKINVDAVGFSAGDAIMCASAAGTASVDDGTAGQKVGFAYQDGTASTIASIAIDCLTGPKADAA